MQQSGSRVNIQAGAYHDEDISSLSFFGGHRYQGYGLTKEHNKRTQKRAVASFCTRHNLTVVRRQRLLEARIVHITTGAHLHQFTMQMYHLGRTGLFMQVIHVLRHHRDIIFILQGSHQLVSLIRFYAPAFLTQHVIEICHQRRIGLPSLMSSHLLHGIFLPQAVSITKCTQPAFHRHASTCQHNNFLLHNTQS